MQGYVVTVQSRFEGVREAGNAGHQARLISLVSQSRPATGIGAQLLQRYELA